MKYIQNRLTSGHHEAPNIGSDADDTAKTILTLSLLGQSISPASMLDAYEKDQHFATYQAERNPSFSANCNILNALLHVGNPDKYVPQIEKAVRFLCEFWWQSDSSIIDKWVLHIKFSTRISIADLLLEHFPSILHHVNGTSYDHPAPSVGW